MPAEARRGDGAAIHPGSGITPLLKAVDRAVYRVVGTAFYITRYGLFMTAGHVAKAIRHGDGNTLQECFLLHLLEPNEISLRPVRQITFFDNPTFSPGDIAIGHADNFHDESTGAALQNMRGELSLSPIESGSRLVTYAYPNNEDLDFTDPDIPRRVRSDYFEGEVIRFVSDGSNRDLPYPHYETTISLENGASGGPVFDANGRIVGVNCAGWNYFGLAKASASNPSYVVPIAAAAGLRLPLMQVPRGSFEDKQMPLGERDRSDVTIFDLARWGHTEPLS